MAKACGNRRGHPTPVYSFFLPKYGVEDWVSLWPDPSLESSGIPLCSTQLLLAKYAVDESLARRQSGQWLPERAAARTGVGMRGGLLSPTEGSRQPRGAAAPSSRSADWKAESS